MECKHQYPNNSLNCFECGENRITTTYPQKPKKLPSKLDLLSLGEFITEFKDGKPYTSMFNSHIASKQCAEKINEILEYLNETYEK